MKIAVLSDIHANRVALQVALEDVAQWRPDHVVFLGDIINRGPMPLECLKMIDEFHNLFPSTIIRGNHEEYVLHQASPSFPSTGAEGEVHLPSRWTLEQINHSAPEIAKWPDCVDIPDPEGGISRFIHGSMLGMRDGIYPETTDEELMPKMGLTVDSTPRNPYSLFCVGHTHRALIRRFGKTLVINAGSVGLPFDGDKRLGYARIQWFNGEWKGEIVRLPYDILKARDDFFTSGYLEDAGPLTQLVLIELLTATSQLYHWAKNYQDQVASGKMSMHDSVLSHIFGL